MSIKQNMIRGVFWSAIEKYSGLIISILVSMVLARLLSPKDYGTVAIVSVIIAFLQMFVSLGIGPAIIQRKDLSQENLNSIFTFSLVAGTVVSGLFFLASPLIANFYDDEALVPICQLLTIQLFFSAINMVPNAIMVREMRFRTLAIRSLILGVITGSLSIGAAFAGAGVYALVLAPVLSAPAIFFWNQHYCKLRVDRRLDMEPIRRIFSFSAYQFLFEFFNYFSRNSDKLIIGKWLTLDALGIYEKSYRLMQMPMNNITAVIHPVMQPVLRDLSDDHAELAAKYNQIVKFVATLSFPIGLALSAMAGECIRFFYGTQWDAAIPVFSILALSLPLQMILSTSGPIYMVCNNTRMQFWLGVRNTATTVLGFVVAAYFWGTIEAVAWAWTITLLLNFAFTYLLLYRFVLQMPIGPMLRQLIRPAIIGTLVFGVISLIDWAGLHLSLTALAVKGAAGMAVALVAVQLLGQYNILDLVKKKLKI